MIITNPKIYTKCFKLACYEQTIYRPKYKKVTALTLKNSRHEILITFSPKQRMNFSLRHREQNHIQAYTETIPRRDGVIYRDIKQHLRNTSLEVTSKLVCHKWNNELDKIKE